MNKLNIAIVGNGALRQQNKDHINESDIVVRFNSPPLENLRISTRCDILFLSNSSKQTLGLINSKDYIVRSPFASAKLLMLPYSSEVISRYMPKPNMLSRLAGRRVDHSDACIEIAKRHGKQCSRLTTSDYMQVCKNVGILPHQMHAFFPSSGIMAIYAILDAFSQHTPIRLMGFGFEGWKRHHWEGERGCVQRLCDKGLVDL